MRRKHVSNNGLITVASRFSVGETLDRLTAALTSAGLLVFARINHASNAWRAETCLFHRSQVYLSLTTTPVIRRRDYAWARLAGDQVRCPTCSFRAASALAPAHDPRSEPLVSLDPALGLGRLWQNDAALCLGQPEHQPG